MANLPNQSETRETNPADAPRLRADLEPLPDRLKLLQLDARGYPVPWFVAWVNGAPEFRAADPRKLAAAVQSRLCWVCGEPLGRWLAFVIGPMCCINRVSAEPPSHLECAQWSARNCPFLNGRKQKRREDEQLAAISSEPAGCMIKRQPNAVAIWICRDYSMFSDGRGGVLFRIGEPTGGLVFYSHGRDATREEVDESVRTGLPLLEQMAAEDGPEAQGQLRQQVERFNRIIDDMAFAAPQLTETR